MCGPEAVEVVSRGIIVLARFDERTFIFAADATDFRKLLRGIQGVGRDAEAGAESVGRLIQLADAEDAAPLVSHDLRAWAEWSHAPEPCA